MTAANVSSARSSARVNEFIAALRQLDAGELARLRRNAGNTLAESRGVLDTFYRILPYGISASQEERYFLVATLYRPRLDPDPGDEEDEAAKSQVGNFGDTLRRIAQPSADESAGVKRRLAALLDAEDRQLNFRLRQMVRLVDGHRGLIDWPQLLRDVLRWDYPERQVQRSWARSYFGSAADRSKVTDQAGAPDDGSLSDGAMTGQP